MSSSSTLPVTVIVPTLNAMAELPEHVAALCKWIGDAQEVIVIDSESEDGSADYLRKHLEHSNRQFLSRPKGLYAAWNEAVSCARAEYVYFATVGDDIEPGGLERLLSAAQKLEADVVLSPPRVVGFAGEPIAGERWPIHCYCDALSCGDAQVLDPATALILAWCFGLQSILGSSASNLYRTEHFRRRPFPEDFGHEGDTLWGRMHAQSTRFVVVPQPVACFRRKPAGQEPAYEDLAYCERLVELNRRASGAVNDEPCEARRMLAQGAEKMGVWQREKIGLLAESLRERGALQAAIEDLRAVAEERGRLLDDLSAACEGLRAKVAARRDNRWWSKFVRRGSRP